MNYDEWNEVKKNTSKSTEKAVKVGKVYWVRLGLNIGSEVYGKGKNYVRPVLVLKLIYKNSFIGVPLSTKAKDNSFPYFYSFYTKNNDIRTALLSQIKLFDTKRVENIANINISKSDFENIRDKIKANLI
ncbi:type II toxin-antitoxin system PemK/MazF family toxin [Campylobacter sp. RM12640]|uniref:type II toxin-antitoxin system PemK/MazF family toxin n=1 Tax=unclassified Campylobacter TaxID=2593542 RepID=UPI001E149EAE|nr:type II toxin-antitoxin system PemK/MazF family toxin [Campylobacter sp. RM12640]MBZ7983639.1 type II toxin-antitoxin system PemK/MazF family toxin [Campylobacter sp. RM12647]MBZ7989778.1 type II toxin-antitoxin system PemK/MazF family toxin [Campylobacter sp. RM12635]MBZ7993753.1 type II toxin-antitoxin system PemK/MazF family toxin [Campylobacter sp. RM9333]